MSGHRALVYLFFSAVVCLPGCKSTSDDGDSGEADTTTDTGDTTTETEGRVLSFVGTSPVDVDPDEAVTLTFSLVDDKGAALSGQAISFALSGAVAALSTTSAVTTSEGEAKVDVQAGDAAGSVVVTASANGATDVTVTVNILDLPTEIDGQYDVLLHLDLGQAVPAPYDAYLDIVAGVLHNPVGYAVYQALLQANTPTIRDAVPGMNLVPWFMDYDCADGSNDGDWAPTPSFDCVEEMAGPSDSWSVITAAIENLIQMGTDAGEFTAQYQMVLQVSDDISDVVTDFEVGARFDIQDVQSGDGTVLISETWRDYVFEWGLFCDADDRGCARRVVTIDESNADRVGMTADYEGTYSEMPGDGSDVTRVRVLPELHNKELQYGSVILLALETVLYPNLCEGCDSLSDVLLFFINCQQVAEAINAEISLIPVSIAQSACNLGLTTGVEELENLVETLSAGPVINTATKEIEGLSAAGELYLVDDNGDLQTNAVADMEMFLQWRGFEDPAMSEDISAPITGEGRLKASFCTRDTDCEDGRSCAPIESYMKVARVEMDCRPMAGEVAGMASCTNDADCASGLCFADAEGSQSCFQACSGDADCTGGSCVSDAASMSLDAVLDGLGDVSVAACVSSG